MQPTPSGIAVAALLRRDRAVLIGSAAFVCAVAWFAMWRAHLPAGGLAAPHVHGAGSGGFALAAAMWMGMMVAMMLPAVMPWILLFAAAERKRIAGSRPLSYVSLFTSGYFAVWAVYSLAAAAAQVAFQREGFLHAPDLRTGTVAGGVLLIAAGVFQWTPLKAACLKHCRTPLGYFLTRWRDGPAGAFRMGFSHGLYCVTCCWALMALSFALGVMNLLWMAILTLMLCIEKIAPYGGKLSRLFGVVLAAWGIRLLVG